MTPRDEALVAIYQQGRAAGLSPHEIARWLDAYDASLRQIRKAA